MRNFKLKLNKKAVTSMLVVFGVALIALGAGVGVSWWQNQGQPAEEVAEDHISLSKEVTDAQQQSVIGNFEEAHKTVEVALSNESAPAQEKHDLYAQQGSIYESQQKNDEAMQSYLKAESFAETTQVAQSIANLAAQKGDKELAIRYYKKAIALLPSDQPQLSENLKKYFENMIIYLEGGQPSDE